MTPCERPLDWLLEADLEELRGEGDGENAVHLGTCKRCREAAERIVSRTTGLDEVLSPELPTLDVDAVLARARMGVEEGDSGRRTTQRTHWRRWAPLVAAASLAGLLLLGQREPEFPGEPVATRVAQRAAIEAPAEHNVAVIQTDNPDITVLWFF